MYGLDRKRSGSTDVMKRKWVWYLPIVALAVLHQDSWWWGSTDLVFGFLPIGLAWHALISLGAGLGWWLVVRKAWPEEFDNIRELER